MRYLVVLLIMLSACAHRAHHGSFSDAQAWAARFEDPARDSWQKPDEVLAALQLPARGVVADIGSATGYFPIRYAKAMPQGTVYGADVESAMVAYLTSRAEKEGLTNVKGIVAAFDDAKLPEPADLVTMVDTYHHLQDRTAYFSRLATQIKPNGRVAIIDYRPESPRGPAHKLSSQTVRSEVEAAGFTLSATHDFLPDQFFLVFTKVR
jgi:cyclopropane fatty-acyl-phospholipid synthase-like methyltransferase